MDMMAEPASILEEEGGTLDPGRFRSMAKVAGIVYLAFVLAHVALGGIVLPMVLRMYMEMGLRLPLLMELLFDARMLVVPVLVLVDIALFWLFYERAKRGRVRLLFVPLFTAMLLIVAFVLALYLPPGVVSISFGL